jgi:hypothetical protein
LGAERLWFTAVVSHISRKTSEMWGTPCSEVRTKCSAVRTEFSVVRTEF